VCLFLAHVGQGGGPCSRMHVIRWRRSPSPPTSTSGHVLRLVPSLGGNRRTTARATSVLRARAGRTSGTCASYRRVGGAAAPLQVGFRRRRARTRAPWRTNHDASSAPFRIVRITCSSSSWNTSTTLCSDAASDCAKVPREPARR